MKTNRNIFLLILVIVPALLWGHGVGKPGPHGGHIQMPGAFHTELVLEEKTSFKVYLLDEAFKSPITENSTLEAVLKANSTDENLRCAPSKTFFACTLTRPLRAGDKISLKAKRDGRSGGFAIYEFPFKFTGAHTSLH